MGAASVVLCTEGTYPFVGGGVSTWCDILCRELAEVDYTIYAVTGAPEGRARYELPPNVRRVVRIPLWGVLEPAEHILADVPFSAISRRKRRTTPAVVEDEFVPLFARFLAAMLSHSPPGADDGLVVYGMWRYFQEYDWRLTWKSEAAWTTFLEHTLRPRNGGPPEPLPEQLPTIADLTMAMRWLYNYLMPLSGPIPRAELVHSTIASVAGLAGVVARRAHGSALLVTEHGVWVRERYIAISAGPFTPFAKRFLMDLSRHISGLVYSHADVVAPVNSFNRRWEEPHGVPPERIETIYNGVDPRLFVPRPKPEKTARRPTVVAAARVFPLKDVETMIRSAAVARELVPGLRYVVYGSLDADIPYVERCRALIAELRLEETFELAGHHAKPAEIYNEGDISVLSSISEAFPYTVLEAMACARPVVATDVGGVREALEGFGILVAPRDHEALGRGVATLLGDDQLRAQLGRQAREAVLARFRIARSVGAYRALYERLAPRGRRAVDQAVA